MKQHDDKAIMIKWESCNEVDGYEIYKANSKKGNYYRLLDADKSYYLMCIDKDVKKKKHTAIR